MYQNEHSQDIVSTWVGCGRWRLVVCFHSIVYTVHRLFRVRVNLDQPKLGCLVAGN